MGLDFLMLFATALGFWWLAGRLIDDTLDRCDMDWWRSLAHEDISRDDERRAA
jgi:hypothetical protein